MEQIIRISILQGLIWDTAICYNRIFSGSVLQNENKNEHDQIRLSMHEPYPGFFKQKSRFTRWNSNKSTGEWLQLLDLYRSED